MDVPIEEGTNQGIQWGSDFLERQDSHLPFTLILSFLRRSLMGGLFHL